MRISKTWLRPILTAVLFPVVLLASMAALDEFSGRDRLPWTKTHYSRAQIISLAETQCFRQFPDYQKFRPWRAKLNGGRWQIEGTESGLPFIISAQFDTLMSAAIDDRDGVMVRCTQLAARW